MFGTDEDRTRSAARAEHRGPRPRGAVHGRGGRRLLAPLAGTAFALALLAGCGGAEEEPVGDPPAETSEEAPTEEATSDDDTDDTDDASDDADDTATDDADDTDDASDDADDTATDDGTDDGDDASAGGENLFEGTWGFGHDTKVLSAEELADLLEEEAERRGPEEMSLDVECADGVDTGIPDYTADCTAFADEGVEHSWTVTVGPADAGLEVEVENAD